MSGSCNIDCNGSGSRERAWGRGWGLNNIVVQKFIVIVRRQFVESLNISFHYFTHEGQQG